MYCGWRKYELLFAEFICSVIIALERGQGIHQQTDSLQLAAIIMLIASRPKSSGQSRSLVAGESQYASISSLTPAWQPTDSKKPVGLALNCEHHGRL